MQILQLYRCSLLTRRWSTIEEGAEGDLAWFLRTMQQAEESFANVIIGEGESMSRYALQISPIFRCRLQSDKYSATDMHNLSNINPTALKSALILDGKQYTSSTYSMLDTMLHIISFSPHNDTEVDNIFYPILQLRKLRLRKTSSRSHGSNMVEPCRTDIFNSA